MTLLRQLAMAALETVEKGIPDRDKALPVALGVAAYRFLQIGGVITLNDNLSPVEVSALEAARERLDAEALARLAAALRSPTGAEQALEPVDGGEAKRRAVMKQALSSRSKGGRS